MSATAASIVIAASQVIHSTSQIGPGWFRIEAGRIVEKGDGDVTPFATDELTKVNELSPGLVDMHVHGAGGVDFAELGVDPQPAIDYHHAAGSTSLVASLTSCAPGALINRIAELAPLVQARRLAGLHLEGPWLSMARRGAHASGLLRLPELSELDAVLEAGQGTIRMVTLAPELAGAIAAIDALVSAGVVVALGHTDADADVVERAIDHGATVITHLFNGMPPLHHRRPGPIGIGLTDQRVSVELIADGVHVNDTVLDLARASAPGRVALVSDAMAATGLGDGTYTLAGSRVVVSEGVARLAEGRSLAGSTTTLGASVARLRARGVPAGELVNSASLTPSRLLGLHAPALGVGELADILVRDPAGLTRTMREGRWLASSS
jgi:N-acetylglucosamine-6-phosphate deacetylase